MRALRFLGALCAVLTLMGMAAAAEKAVAPKKENNLTLLNRSLQDVPVENCERRDVCDLKRLLFVSDDYQLAIGKNEYQYFTLMYATYETATFATLEKYAFVQFIRGSAFTSRKDLETGEIDVAYNRALGNFNQWLVYRIPSWIIDAGEATPAYMSVEGASRHYWYRWQREILPPPWISQEEYIFCGNDWKPPSPSNKETKNEELRCKNRPSAPRLYVDDEPEGALVLDGVARNVSLEFKTCLYKSADVPQTTERDNVNFAEPLYCFPWRTSFVYNHDLKKFESPPELVFPGLTEPNELIILGDRKKRSEQSE